MTKHKVIGDSRIWGIETQEFPYVSEKRFTVMVKSISIKFRLPIIVITDEFLYDPPTAAVPFSILQQGSSLCLPHCPLASLFPLYSAVGPQFGPSI